MRHLLAHAAILTRLLALLSVASFLTSCMNSPEPMIDGEPIELVSDHVGLVKTDLLSTAYGLLDFGSSEGQKELYMEMKLQADGRYLIKGGHDSTLQRYLEFRKLQAPFLVVQSVKAGSTSTAASYALVSVEGDSATLFDLSAAGALKDPTAALLLGVTKAADNIEDSDIRQAESLESLDQLDTFFSYLAVNPDASYLKQTGFSVYDLVSTSGAKDFRKRREEIDEAKARCKKLLEEAESSNRFSDDFRQCMSPELAKSIFEDSQE